MNFDMPKAVFCGLALIAAAIYFGPGSVPAEAQGGVQKVAICDQWGQECADVSAFRLKVRNRNKGKHCEIYLCINGLV